MHIPTNKSAATEALARIDRLFPPTGSEFDSEVAEGIIKGLGGCWIPNEWRYEFEDGSIITEDLDTAYDTLEDYESAYADSCESDRAEDAYFEARALDQELRDWSA